MEHTPGIELERSNQKASQAGNCRYLTRFLIWRGAFGHDRQNHPEAPNPARALAALGVGSGDELELIEGHDRFTLQRRCIQYSRLGTLRS